MEHDSQIAALPRREREIFEIVCSAGEIVASDIRARMTDPPTASAVRTLLVRLEGRGLIRYREEGRSYIYSSVSKPAKVRESLLRQLVDTLFNGSAASTATALLGLYPDVKDEELDAVQAAIDRARARS